MKKLFFIIFIIVVGYFGYNYFINKTSEPKVEIATKTSKPDIANAIFEIEGEKVSLINGKASTKIAEDSATLVETSLTGEVVYSDINNDGLSDAVSLAMQSGGGSGLFVYLLAYVSGNVMYKSAEPLFLGDRISPQNLNISQTGLIEVSYLDRLPDESMASEPTKLITKTFKLVGNKLEER